jgi:hypothetical protein
LTNEVRLHALGMSVASRLSTHAADRATPHEPAWEIARLFPAQGAWTEEAYLSFTESMNQFCELVDGRVQVPDTPTKTHRQIVRALLALFLAYLRPQRRGDAIAAPYRVRVLTLDSGDYVTAADQLLNEAVTSRLFPDFAVTIADLLPTC